MALCLVASNGICYAATGHSWVTKAIVYINGEASEQDIVMEKQEDGNVQSIDMTPEEVQKLIESGELQTDSGSVTEEEY